MAKALKILFLVHALVALGAGLPLLIAPGRLLTWVGWAPIDPIAARLLGAALLALGWGSLRGWQALRYDSEHAAGQRDVRLLLQLEAAFTALAAVGLGRHLLVGRWPLLPWLLFAVLLAFTLAWAFFLVRKE